MLAFFPYDDEAPRKNFPFLTLAIILINLFAYLKFNFRYDYEAIVLTYGFIPDNFSFFTMITSIFLHGNFMHLLLNMWFFWIFADNVEDAVGPLFFLGLYFAGAFAAGLMHYFLSSPFDKGLPCIGASGAISAIIAMYMVLFPKAKVKMFVLIGVLGRIKKVKAVYYIGFWFLSQYVLTFFSRFDNISYASHVGGFAFGLAVGYVFNEFLRAPEPPIGG
jgi:membrane associated rhomboid family serine protease